MLVTFIITSTVCKCRHIDSLLHAYKQDELDKDSAIDDESDQHPKKLKGILKNENLKIEVLKSAKIESSSHKNEVGMTNIGDEATKHGHGKKSSINRVKLVTIKTKHQIMREDRTSKILLPVLNVKLLINV